jgi:hypothetical protein
MDIFSLHLPSNNSLSQLHVQLETVGLFAILLTIMDNLSHGTGTMVQAAANSPD